MSFKATLHIEDRVSNILYCEYSFLRQVNKDNFPTTYPQSGFVILYLEASRDDFFECWSLSSSQKKSGSIVFYKRDNMSKMKELVMTDVYCVYFREKFQSLGTHPFYNEIKLSAGELRYGQSVYRNPWFETAGREADFQGKVSEFGFGGSETKNNEDSIPFNKEKKGILSGVQSSKDTISTEGITSSKDDKENKEGKTNTSIESNLLAANNVTDNPDIIKSEAEKNKLIDAFLEHIVISEGGFVDHPHDPGGKTKFGIAEKREWIKAAKLFGMDPNPDNIKNITKEQAKSYYMNTRVKELRIKEIKDPKVANAVMDQSVLTPGLINQNLKRSLNLQGKNLKVSSREFSDAEIRILNECDNKKLLQDFKNFQLEHYESLKTKPKCYNTYITNIKGWRNRLNKL